jgi:hypothetical protein
MTTVYFCSPVANLDDAVSPAPFVGVITGKPGGTLLPGETSGSNEVGNYWDGMGYSDSSTFDANLTGKYVNMVGLNGHEKDSRPLCFFAGTPPGNGDKITSITKYEENGTDNGVAAQDGVTYYKYSATL